MVETGNLYGEKIEKMYGEKIRKFRKVSEEHQKKTAAEVMPNSLQASVGKPGYDEDGVRLLCNEAGRYNWPETLHGHKPHRK